MSKVKANYNDGVYSDNDGNEVKVITEGTGKNTVRWIRSELTENELADIQNTKGKLAARKICALAKEIDKRVKNLLNNQDQKLSEAELEMLSNFLGNTTVSAQDKLAGVAEVDTGLPF